MVVIGKTHNSVALDVWLGQVPRCSVIMGEKQQLICLNFFYPMTQSRQIIMYISLEASSVRFLSLYVSKVLSCSTDIYSANYMKYTDVRAQTTREMHDETSCDVQCGHSFGVWQELVQFCVNYNFGLCSSSELYVWPNMLLTCVFSRITNFHSGFYDNDLSSGLV